MPAPIVRTGEGVGPVYKKVNVEVKYHKMLIAVATKENTTMTEVLRFLIEMASEGKVEFK